MLAAPAELRKVRFPQFESRQVEVLGEITRDGNLPSGFGVEAAREGRHISQTVGEEEEIAALLG